MDEEKGQTAYEVHTLYFDNGVKYAISQGTMPPEDSCFMTKEEADEWITMHVIRQLEPHEERLIKEYLELKEKTEKLEAILVKVQSNELNYELKCTPESLQQQLVSMVQYINALENRADFQRLHEKGYV